jgi:hypothetical protein
MTGALLAPILALLLAVGPGLLAERAAHWPDWHLPAPLARPSARPGRQDLTYPSWMEGHWQVRSTGPSEEDLTYPVRFSRDPNGAVVGDRAFNATAIGRALLGTALLQVANDPANPNRQIAVLAGDQRLESTVVGRRSEQPDPSHYWTDELALQVLHGPGDPRVSRVETLSHYSLRSDGSVSAEQWQASYPSPALGLAAAASGSGRYRLELARLSPDPPRPQSDPAS